MKIRSEQFLPVPANDAAAADRPQKFIDAVARVIKAEPNVPRGFRFEFVPGPGWLRSDAEDVSAPPVQEVAGGLSHLDELSDWIIRTRLPVPPSRGLTPLPQVAALIAAVCLICEFAFRRIAASREDVWPSLNCRTDAVSE
jgi:hypothetical protein